MLVVLVTYKTQDVELIFNAASKCGRTANIYVFNGNDNVYSGNIDDTSLDTEQRVRFTIKPGENIIEFQTDADQVVSENDIRELYMCFMDIRITMDFSE